MYPLYLGIDLHLKKSYMVLMNQEGEILEEGQVANTKIKEFLKEKVQQETYAVLEATRNWPFVYDLLREHLQRVELAHPKRLKAISAAAVKTDRIDARTLAHLARMNYLPIAYAAPTNVRDLRLRMRHRKWLIQQRTQCKNRIHAILAQYNLVSPVKDLFGVTGREWLAEAVVKIRPMARTVIIDNLEMIEWITKQADILLKNVELDQQQRQAYKLLVGMPGMGQIVALTMIGEIGDIGRFQSPKSLCNWAGLTPRERSSGDVVRRGRISKEGSTHLRGVLGHAAIGAARKSKRWRNLHDRFVKRQGRQAAKVTVARRLLTVAYYVWTRNQPYREDYRHQSQDTLNQGA